MKAKGARRKRFGKRSQVPGSRFGVRGKSRIEDPNPKQQGAGLFTYVRSVANFMV
jgi:hypothetical protein